MPEPQLVLLTGHGAPVEAVAFSPDGDTLASGGCDRRVFLWDASTGALRAHLEGHGSEVTAVAFSPDGSVLATSGRQDEVRLWDAGTGRWLGAFPTLAGPLAFTAEGGRLVGRRDEEFVVLDSGSGQVLRTVGLDGEELVQPAVSLHGSHAAAASYADGRYVLFAWDLRTGDQLLRYEVEFDVPGEVRSRKTGEMAPVRFRLQVDQLAVSSRGRWLAVAGNSTIWICDLRTGQRTQMLACGGGLCPRSLAFSADERLLAVGDASGVIRIWDAASGDLHRTIRAHASWASALAFSPKGESVASGGHDRCVCISVLATGEQLPGLPGLQREVKDVAYSPDGCILASAHQDGAVRCWDATTGMLRRTLRCCYPGVSAVAISPDGEWLAAGSSVDWYGSCAVEVWSLATGTRRQVYRVGAGSIETVVFFPNSPAVVASRWGRAWKGTGDRTFVWDLETWKLRYHVEGHTAAVSRDGTFLATATAVARRVGAIQIRDAATGEVLQTLHRDAEIARNANLFRRSRFSEDWFESLRFSPDGRTLVAGYDGPRIGMWDIATGGHVWEARTDRDSIHGLAFSPDGFTLALGGSYQEEVALWDVAARRERGRLIGHTDAVEGIAFSPDGTRLATASDDGTIKVWSPAEGRLLTTLRMLYPADPGADEEWIAYTPARCYTGSAGAHGFIRWKVGDELLSSDACHSEFHRPHYS